MWHYLRNQSLASISSIGWLAHGNEVALLPYFGGFVAVSFSGHCVLAHHFHGWIMAGLFVSPSVDRCFGDVARTALSWGSGFSGAQVFPGLSSPVTAGNPLLCPILQPGDKKQAISEKLKQGSSLIETTQCVGQIWRIFNVRDHEIKRFKQLLKHVISKANHTKGDVSWPQWGKTSRSSRMINSWSVLLLFFVKINLVFFWFWSLQLKAQFYKSLPFSVS